MPRKLDNKSPQVASFLGNSGFLMDKNLGASPQPPPGFYRFNANPEAAIMRGAAVDTLPQSWPLSRRSGCFPALPYPPPRASAIVQEKRRSGAPYSRPTALRADSWDSQSMVC
jgi:hypothetical protein